MTPDLRTFVVHGGEEPPATCLGAAQARAEATRRVERGEPDIRILNSAGVAFRWWIELCSEPACYALAVEAKSYCASHATLERRRGRDRDEARLERAARELVAACQRAEAAAAKPAPRPAAEPRPRSPRRVLAFELIAPGLDRREVEAAVPSGARRAGRDLKRVVLRGREQALAVRDALLCVHPGAVIEVVELPPEEGQP